MRRTDQRRAAVVALYQHDLTGRPLAETLGPNASLFARALAHAAADRARGARRGDRPPRARLVGAADPAARAQHHARRADRDAAPGRGARRRSRSRRRARSRRRSRARRRSAAPTRRASSTACSRAVLREVRENAQHPMSSAEHLDELIARLERAAEQLRSGELSPDAAATLVEDCAVAGDAGGRRARAAARAPRCPAAGARPGHACCRTARAARA